MPEQPALQDQTSFCAISEAESRVCCLTLTRRMRQYASSSKASEHVRKVSSSLQFDIELMEGQSRGSSSKSLLGSHHLAGLPPALAVAALVEAKDPQESSIAMQVGWGGVGVALQIHLGHMALHVPAIVAWCLVRLDCMHLHLHVHGCPL